jgi:hypothetical protein
VGQWLGQVMKNLSSMYIISWFGNDDIRSQRAEYHKKQLAWAKSQGLAIYVVAQQYQKHEYDSEVTYLDYTLPEGVKVLLPAEARNVCLRHFYKSNANFAIMADNDAVLYDKEQHCDSKDFVETFNKVDPLELTGVDLFLPINPARVPFTKEHKDNRDTYNNHFVFKRATEGKGSFAVIKNFKKFYNNEIYYDEKSFMTSDRKIIPHEDTDFLMSVYENGYSGFMCKNIVLRELAYANDVSTWAGDTERNAANLIGKTIIRNKYKLTTTSNGNTNYRPLWNRINSPTTLLVPKGKNKLTGD